MIRTREESPSACLNLCPESVSGNKKFKIRSLKTRLFRKSKKSGEEKAEKLSQSASDITFAERLGSDEDLLWVGSFYFLFFNVRCILFFFYNWSSYTLSFFPFHPLRSGQRIMGSRAFSHDSIFLSEEGLSDPEPARILSQENVPGKIKALQVLLFCFKTWNIIFIVIIDTISKALSCFLPS